MDYNDGTYHANRKDAVIIKEITPGNYTGVSWENTHNGVGGFEAKYNIYNNTDKVIKYVWLHMEPVNAVGDVVESSIGDGSERTIKITGPIEPHSLLVSNRNEFMHSGIIWYNGSIHSIRCVGIDVEYMDGSKTQIDGNDVVIDPSIGTEKRNIPSQNYQQASNRNQFSQTAQAPSSPQDQGSGDGGGLGTASIALGVVGIVMAWLLAILGYVFGGVGLTLALVAKGKEPGSTKWKAGLALSIIALIFSAISSAIGIMMMT